MRFRTRAFLSCFVPFALLLSLGFWMIQRFVQATVREGVRTSLRENQRAIAHQHTKSDLQNNRFLKVVGENASLKVGIQLLVSESGSEAARRTVEDQLRELGEHMGFDFLLVSAPDGTPLAGVVRQADTEQTAQLVPIDTALLRSRTNGIFTIDGHVFQAASVPVDLAEENIGSISIGEFFNFSEFTSPAILLHNGRVVASSVPRASAQELEAALHNCAGHAECDLKLNGASWISLPIPGASFGEGYVLRTMEDVDAAIAPVEAVLHHLFLVVALGSVIVAFLCSLVSSRSIVRPIAAVVDRLRSTASTGVLPEFDGSISSIQEIKELVENFNRAAVSVRVARETLQNAYVEFVGSLANALDARDRYTAGHSLRVSQLSSATAASAGLDPDHIERVRVGALLHDIGKIGVADHVLQKAGRLTDDEFAQVKEHPVIGRRILEGVNGLAPFLEAVELHHENWDGSGYPIGQSGFQTPIDARIIHVSDAYDAMTTDRSYRKGLTHERAVAILREYAGVQFDPEIVEHFAALPRQSLITQELQERPAFVPSPLSAALPEWETA